MSWVIFTLFAAVFYAVSVIIRKKILKKEHSLDVSIIFNISGVVILLFFLSFFNFKLTIFQYVLIYLVSFLDAIAFYLGAKVLKYGDISHYSPLSNITVLVALFFAAVLLGERLNYQQGIGIFLIVLGSFYLEFEKEKLNNTKKIFNSTMWMFLITVILIGFNHVTLKYILFEVDYLTTTFLTYFFITLNLMAFHFFLHNGSKLLFKAMRNDGKFILVSALFSVFSTILYFKALTLGPVSLAVSLKRIQTMFVTILGGRLFHEKEIFHRASACLIIVIGVILISL